MTRSIPVILFLAMALGAACEHKPRRVVIGIAVSFSNHPGSELAVQEINASGGINGVPLELMGLEWRTNKFKPEDILAWAKRFSETEELVAVIGHSDSASTLSAAAYYNQYKIPQIATIATNPAITNIGDWTYRLCISDADQGPALAEYSVKDWGKKRIAVFYVNDDYGRGIAQLYQQHARNLGAEIVSSVMHRNALQPDDKDLINLTLKSLKQEKDLDLIVLYQRIEAGIWTIRAIREAGLTADILCGDSLSSLDLIKKEPVHADGIRVSVFALPDPEDSKSIEFIENFRRFTGNDPDYGNAFGYDAVYLIRDAVKSNGFSREGVKAYLDRLIKEKTVIAGVGGKFSIGEDHDGRRALYVAEMRKNGYNFIKALPIH